MKHVVTPLDQRFLAKVSKSAGCWLWTGAKSSAGYGTLNRGRAGAGFVLAHRYAWERAHGAIPSGVYVCHRCDRPSCVRLSHLFLGSPSDNMWDASQKGRLSQPGKSMRGEKNPIAKLTDARAVAARSMFAAGMSHLQIARLANVSEACIQNAVSGKSFRHLPGALSAADRSVANG